MQMFDRIRAISLDLDDTLWPIQPTIERAEQTLQEWLCRRAPRTRELLQDRPTMSRLREKALRVSYEARHDLGAVRRESIRLLLTEAGEDPNLASAAYEVFFEARQRVTLFEGAGDALARLSQCFPLVALSNGNADIRRIGIAHHFSGSVSAADFGIAKPDPRIFWEAARLAGAAPDQVLHVGDDPALDVAGAHKAGLLVAWLNRARAPWDLNHKAPHLEIESLTALCAHLGVP